MFTRITTILTAATLSLGTAFADPALARDRSDNANLLGGLIVGGLIGATIANDNNNNDRHDRGQVTRGHRDGYDVRTGHGRGHDKGYGHNKRGYGHNKRVNLPGACRVYNGHRSGYSGRCLRGYDYGHAALPSACAVRVGGHHRTIYRDRCLNQYGYY